MRKQTAIANRAYQNYAPVMWNSLPNDMRAMPMNLISNLDAFKRKLKTYLFTAAFSRLT